MPAMYFAAFFLITAGLTWGLRLGLDPEPLGAEPAGLVAITAVLASLIAGAGILLAGSVWARRLGAATVAGGFALAAVMPFDAGGAVALLLSITAAIGLVVSRHDTTHRRRRAPEIPRPAIITSIGLIWMPAVAGVASPNDGGPVHWILAIASLGGAWMYSRAHPAGLWVVRTALLPLAIWAATLSPLPGAVMLVTAASCIVAAAWTGDARLAVDPLVRNRVPAPNPFTAAGRDTRR
jgi:hypothetical protein